jgi:ubiquinone/menaquinone biosynthesis C-methylase UbiE
MPDAAFDPLADMYDATFSNSLVGYEQRMAGRKHLLSFLAGKKNLKILEINCGTGEDALWLASLGHTVIATDKSASMIQVAQKKVMDVPGNSVTFRCCNIEEELISAFPTEKFDLIFSNFSGLNCISPKSFDEVTQQLLYLLNTNGHLAAVIFGKYSLWEMTYFLLKADFKSAFRRWGNKQVNVQLNESISQTVYYYSPGRFVRMLSPFKLVTKKPIGIAIPPSYMEPAMQKRQRFFKTLVNFEKRMSWFTAGSALADHTYVLLKKNTL